MKLSTRGRYGTRLMVELSKRYGEGPTSVSEISRNQNIPVKYLEQLIIPLKRARLLKSARGPKGGHMLARPPDKISIWEILNVLESSFTVVDCAQGERSCENFDDCLVRPVWRKAYQAMKKQFIMTSLHDILEANPEESCIEP